MLAIGFLAAFLLLAGKGEGASVGPAGYTNSFSTQPPAADWATQTRAGIATDTYNMDADVNANITASGVTAQTASNSGNPPAAASTATWSSSGGYLQTRPTGIRYMALMGKFINNSGTNATQVTLSYVFTIAAGGVAEEAGMGSRVYYSLTGLANGWTNLAALNTTASANGSTSVRTNLALNWPIGASLYLLWVDDNSSASGTESANQFDNFSLQVTASLPPGLACSLNTPADQGSFASDASITAAASVVNGTPPYSVEYFTNSGAGNTVFVSAGSNATAPYQVSLGSLPPGTFNIHAVATDSAGSPATTNSTTNTFFVADPIAFTLTAPVDGATFDHTSDVAAAAMVAGGTAPYSVRFHVDGVASGAAVTSAPYVRNLGPLFVGVHTIRAVVTDARGWMSNSLPGTVQITGPLGVALTPTNGALYNFGQLVILEAAGGGGIPPHTVTFYTNDQLVGSVTSPPFATNLGLLPVGSYTGVVHIADSSSPIPLQAGSTTNIFSILPNPLGVSLTSPVSGLNVTAGQPLALAAAVTVGPPVFATNVEFFLDGASAGMDSAAPFSVLVATVAAGNHLVHVAATDSLGRVSYSSTNRVTAVSGAPGSNNHFTNAIPLDGLNVTTTGSNVGATREPGEPSIAGSSSASVWWTWTSPDNGLTTIDTFGSSFDTVLGIYTGNAVNQLTTIASNDDYNGAESRVQFNATAGTLYRIGVGSFSSSSQGSITLHIQGPNGVFISSPTNGAVFTVGDPIPFAATFSTNFPSPPATRVDFYRAGIQFASVTNAPFAAVATNSPLGTNSFYIIAFNSLSQSYTSAPVNVFVQNIGVTLLLPLDGSYWNFNSTSPIPVTAWGYLPPGSGSITNIEFYVDGQKFGQDLTPPYSAVWSNPVGGSHRLTAIGRSDTGASYGSQPVNIAVYRTLMPVGSIWKYLDNGSNQGTNWVAPNFDDSTWASGPAPLGYSDSNGRFPATTNSFGPDPNNKYITTYYRQAIVITNLPSYIALYNYIQRDDGVVLYLNGTEIFRNNMPSGTITQATPASSIASDDGSSTYFAAPDRALFVEGTNVFAAEIHQNVANTPDSWFQLQLFGAPRIVFNLSPLVDLTSPTNNDYFLAPSNLTLTASASDPDGNVARVEFFADGTKIGEATNAPYRFDWNTPAPGPHSLTAVATDDQGATQLSLPVHIDVYDAAGTPFARITSPVDGAAVEGGTNLPVTAYASAPGGVTNVQFFSNGSLIGAALSPVGGESNGVRGVYSIVWDAPFGTNVLTAVAFDTNGVSAASAAVNLTVFPNATPPTVATQTPVRGATIGSFTSVVVTFSERVQHVNAGDLQINGFPATSVGGSGSNYVFTFPQPPYGSVTITWAAGHGITDFGFPSDLPFDELGSGAQWNYTLVDRTAPTLAARTPAAGSTVTNLSQIAVTFSELVTNVDASDLLVNGTPALGLTGGGSNYIFTVAPPPRGTVNISWATNHGIFDLAETPNAFNGTNTNARWSFTLDPRVVLVQSNSNWKFFKGFTEASTPTDAWRQPGFNDSTWSNSPAPFYYGDPYSNVSAGIPGTLLGDMQGNYTTLFLRREFFVASLGAITNLVINHQSDDGFIAWLNGVEVFRYNVPGGELPFTSVASSTANEPNDTGAAYLVATLSSNAVARLVQGTNVLAVQALNQALNSSSDFGFNAQLYYFPADPGDVPPRLVGAEPAAGDVFSLDHVTLTFSEGISGVDAGDLLVNGAPATGASSTTNTSYTFTFPQPPYGPVLLTWSTNHGIADLDTPPKGFDAASGNATVGYTLINPSNPRVSSQIPLASTAVTGLTSITVAFTEPVAGVEASDFLVGGIPANGVASADNVTYSFSFPQPPFGTVTIRWATNHGITDLEAPPNPFDPTRFGGQWNYALVDPAPAVALTSPTNGAYLLAPANVQLRANASDNDGTIALVEFYEGATRLGEATNAPYSLTVSNVPEGSYVLRAVATDNSGLLGTSAPVVLNVVTTLPVTLTRGPYLQSGTPTSGLVRWRSDLDSDAVVNYGTDPTALTNVASQALTTDDHVVSITGLQPDTRYYYSIGTSAQRLAGTNGAASDYWFKTSPLPGTKKPTRLWVLGDSGTAGNGSPARQAAVRDAYDRFAATNGPADFWLMLGDNAYDRGQDDEYQKAVFDMYPATLRNLFLWPALGNHETSQSTTATDFPYLNIFSPPQNGEAGGVPSGTKKYYSFDYANIHFVCLDSMTSGRTATSPMAQWLENDLATTEQDWVIVYFHHSLYTKGTHDSDSEGDLVELRQNIVPILEANGVDLVLNGHSHVYERSFLLDGHYGLSGTLTDSMKVDAGDGREDGNGAYQKNDAGRGVVYTIAGCSGQALGGALNHPAHFISLNELGSVVIDVASNRLDAIFLNSSGVTRDHYTLQKRGPDAPAGLVARALGTNSIALTWRVATDETGYIIERSTNGIDFDRFATNSIGVTNALDGGRLASTTYFYRVRAVNSLGESNPSAVAGATTVAAAAAPSAPDRLVASASSGTNAFRSQILLRWRDRSAEEAGFVIERSADGNAFAALGSVGANVTLYVDRKLPSATTYYYRVRSHNPAGESAPSNLDADQTHPQSDLVLRGETAIFHAGVEGVPPISYQWRFMDADLPGATGESLSIANAQGTDEGAYTVVITDATGTIVSNPAWLFVLAPPVIVEDPASRTNRPGESTTFQVVADGTPPFQYQWRQNGVNVAGAHAPQYTIGPVTFSDEADYDVVVLNESGSVTSRVARLTVSRNRPPVLATFPDYFVNPLTVLAVTNTASDPDAPTNTITYSLAPGAPTNATINATNGLFRWRPTLSQAPSTNVISVRATDNGAPPLSDTNSFVVTVNDYLQVTAGSTVLFAGTNGNVPIDIFSTAGMLGLECVLQFAGDRLTNFSVEALDPATADVSLVLPDMNTALLTFTAATSQAMQGTQHLARLHFTAAAGQTSGFMPLGIGSLTNTMARSSVAPALFANDGRVVVVGDQPLLEARLGAQRQRQLVIYGKPGTTYNLQSRFSLAPATAWTSRMNVTPTSTAHALSPPSPAAPVIYFRLVE